MKEWNRFCDKIMSNVGRVSVSVGEMQVSLELDEGAIHADGGPSVIMPKRVIMTSKSRDSIRVYMKTPQEISADEE